VLCTAGPVQQQQPTELFDTQQGPCQAPIKPSQYTHHPILLIHGAGPPLVAVVPYNLRACTPQLFLPSLAP